MKDIDQTGGSGNRADTKLRILRLEEALIEYVMRYGMTEKARAALLMMTRDERR